jgi:hypothetical protein
MGEFDFDVVSDMDELLRLRQPPAPEKMDVTGAQGRSVPQPETPATPPNGNASATQSDRGRGRITGP